MSTTRSASAFILAIITILIFVSVSLSAADYQGTAHTIPAYVEIEFAEQRVNEPAGKVAINLYRSGDYRLLSTLEYRTSENEASEGTDYKGSGGTITFQPGESYKTVYVDVIADDEVEHPESFVFELTSPSPNTVLSRSSTIIWIDDAPTAISQPRIDITPGGNATILVSWESTQEWNLIRSANPFASTSWEPVPEAPAVYGVRYEVTQPLGEHTFFYRLRRE